MASVWEERFKEEAAKTIPLQEVDLKICKYLLSLDVLFSGESAWVLGLLCVERGYGASAQEEDGVDWHQDGQDSF